jgi:tetratricopeptide (TPR) repeat protein
MALAAGQLEKAVDGANRLLALAQQYQNDWNYGNAINEAHTVLGRVFLKNGDVQMAKFHLNQSSIDIATPQTTSFGPSLELAEELAKVGETACVLEYLDKFELLCGLDNQPAFDLRFAIKNGQQRDHANVSELERYEVALHEHQLSTLRARDPVKRAKHLAELLEKTRSRVQTWSVRLERAKLEENAQSIDSAEQMLKREQEHLLNLEALSAD